MSPKSFQGPLDLALEKSEKAGQQVCTRKEPLRSKESQRAGMSLDPERGPRSEAALRQVETSERSVLKEAFPGLRV